MQVHNMFQDHIDHINVKYVKIPKNFYKICESVAFDYYYIIRKNIIDVFCHRNKLTYSLAITASWA